MKKTGKFYGLGIGPGDPELITVKAVNILENVSSVIAPYSVRESVALKIARPYIGGEVIKLRFPMEKDKAVLDKAWDENATVIRGLLEEGKDVAFITLGDPMIYSTYTYILERLKDFEVETVPGITSFTAAAAKLNMPIAGGDKAFAVIPFGKEESLKDALERYDHVVLMKISRDFDKILKLLDAHGFEAGFVSRCGQKEEIVSWNPKELKGEHIDYLSLMIARRKRQ